ncbi:MULTISPECIES: arylsulfatase [unclassified Lentimonas]|nr:MULTISPECIES: arylsulfatase [unclassified Lentimonas]CAA6679376.1 Arylsulfatase [Lentimonas sp. CC4]CAA6687345.1 Arylsulfatase [Lentimonas sp. CC6]CAA7078017.1 Arylsulfatase [Lentimonas sp. CC4]CAA7167987.1 Arylsulfatase [Lentimonas sp. CC21]CAA7179561.1 Arylsulfatase [Lentimonas sp. CC8]
MSRHFPFLILLTLCTLASAVMASERPNIVLIMCDDMGFSDLGSYGGEIDTPNIDALAQEGVRFTQFKNTGRCCPSRAALMTGRNQHSVGMGWMAAVDEHRPGYRGQLSAEFPTIAEVLKENGYGTYISGKWHLTVDGNVTNPNAGPNGSWAFDRGFDESYGGLVGGGSYYKVKGLVRNNERITTFPEDYYYTDAITQTAVEFIDRHDTENPLFLYLAHYAPHRPLQAPQDRIDQCIERYQVGYDVLRQSRYERLVEQGLLTSDLDQSIQHKGLPEWNSLKPELQQKWITEMATYAAMIEIMDDGIGEVVNALKRKGIYDNTVLFFLSDNGATMEGGSASWLGAYLSNTPFSGFKAKTFEGGISSPLIVHFPSRFGELNGEIRHDRAHIIDLLPTCLDIAGLDYPESFNEKAITPPDGVSLLPAITGESLPPRDLFFEHQGSCAIISGKWKLVRADLEHSWKLFDLQADPYEQKDVAKSHPEVAQRLEGKWLHWAGESDVLPLEPTGWSDRVRKYKKQFPDQDGLD